MSVIFTLLMMSLLSQCWAAPQRRNWTPQAILYLKGAQGHRSALARTTREEEDALRLVTLNQNVDGRGSFLDSSLLLELLHQTIEEGRRNNDKYLNSQDQSLSNF